MALATSYTLEPNYTQVVFSWDHLGYSYPTARIAQGQGMLEFDAMHPSRATLQGSNPRTRIATIGFNATGSLKRSEFGLGKFVPQVGDEVLLQVTCQGAESKAYAAYLEARKAGGVGGPVRAAMRAAVSRASGAGSACLPCHPGGA